MEVSRKVALSTARVYMLDALHGLEAVYDEGEPMRKCDIDFLRASIGVINVMLEEEVCASGHH